MTNPSSPVSIVICAYTLDRWQDLCEAVHSARAQVPPVEEIILVIDHNRELEEKVKEAFPYAAVIANREGKGLSGARNTGVAHSRGKSVAFLDDDAVASSNWAAEMHAECEKPGVAGAVPMIEPQWVGPKPSWFPGEFLWVVGCSYKGLPEGRQEVRNLLGSACVVRRDLFERIGGFNHQLGRTESGLPMGCEETEFCIRARQSTGDVKFIFQPSTVIRHKVPAARQTWRYFTMRCYAEGLSKAYLASIVGVERGLSAERAYVFRTLPAGVARGLGDALLRLDWSGLGRATAIVWGLACATIGYARGKLRTSRQKEQRFGTAGRQGSVRQTT
jgi:glucosyl-dolichyl phosphate glucuronosyltransferase